MHRVGGFGETKVGREREVVVAGGGAEAVGEVLLEVGHSSYFRGTSNFQHRTFNFQNETKQRNLSVIEDEGVGVGGESFGFDGTEFGEDIAAAEDDFCGRAFLADDTGDTTRRKECPRERDGDADNIGFVFFANLFGELVDDGIEGRGFGEGFFEG